MMTPLEIYKKLYLIRKSEELIISHYKEDEMKTPMHMSMGEEAIVVGVVAALSQHDQVFGTYRSHALYLAKTNDWDGFFAELYGRVSGIARGRAGSMHIANPKEGMMMSSAVVGTTIPVAVGAALSNKIEKNKKIVVSFFGDGAVNEGVFWESLNFACLKKLPILFVCEDNDLAIHSFVRDRDGYKSLSRVVGQFNCLVEKSETTDVFEINKLTHRMISQMKQKNLPGFLHLKYYRYLEHVGIDEDFDFGYRSRGEFLKWKKQDPVKVSRRKLSVLRISEKEISAQEKKIEKILESSIKKAKKAAFPNASELFVDIYG